MEEIDFVKRHKTVARARTLHKVLLNKEMRRLMHARECLQVEDEDSAEESEEEGIAILQPVAEDSMGRREINSRLKDMQRRITQKIRRGF